MINWKVRIKNKFFWLALVPAVLVLIKSVATVFGYDLELGNLSQELIDVIEAAFIVLSILGIVNDPTTAGIQDSTLAMTYDAPKPHD